MTMFQHVCKIEPKLILNLHTRRQKRSRISHQINAGMSLLLTVSVLQEHGAHKSQQEAQPKLMFALLQMQTQMKQ